MGRAEGSEKVVRVTVIRERGLPADTEFLRRGPEQNNEIKMFGDKSWGKL